MRENIIRQESVRIFGGMVKGRTDSTEKKTLCDSVIVTTMYAMDSEGNPSVYEKIGMFVKDEGMNRQW